MQICMARAQIRARPCSECRTITRVALLCFGKGSILRPQAHMTTDVVAPAPATAAANEYAEAHSTESFKALLIGSIGVVYGDIGTSPLYAFREAVVAASGSAGMVTTQAVLGVVSL